MDHQFTEKVQAWLEAPTAERDYDQGALYLLQLSNNQIMYRNVSRNSKRNAEFIEYNIRKYMKFRLADLTHAQVSDMQKQVEKIAQLRHLDTIPQKKESTSPTADADAQAFRAGKRADHDTLPPEIQALYVENADIIHRMRELHMQLRNLSTDNATCPDSERYPFLKDFIDLDKKYHRNWHLYDSYSATKAAQGIEQQLIEDDRQAQKNIYRQINLAKGRYKKHPSETLKDQIATLYGKLVSPMNSLTAELIELNIIPSTAF